MKYKWGLVLLLVVLQSWSSDAVRKVWESIYKFPKNKTKVGITVAKSECKHLGPSFDLPDDQNHRELLRQAMKDMAVAPAWLAIRKIPYGSWTWINGTKAKSTTIRDGTETEMCGAVSLQERNIVPSNCNDDRNGFVCEIKGSRGCTLKHFTQACVQVQTKSYIIGCKVQSWYKARELCQDYEADLAVVESGEVLNRILKYITDGQFAGVCSWLFIGLSKEDWKIHMSSDVLVPRYVNWTSSEPRQDSSLVQLAFSGDTYSWKSVQSDLTAAVICKDYSRQYAVVQPNPALYQQTVTTTQHSAPVWIFVVTALASVALTLVVIGVVLFLRKRIGNKEKRSIPTENEAGPDKGDETKELLPVQQTMDESDVKTALGDKIRIGIFLDNESSLMWKSEEQSQEDGGELFPNIVIKEYVRVVKSPNANIRLLNLSKFIEGKVRKNTSSTLEEIKQLAEKYNLDAVYLPEMQAPEIITSKHQPSPIDQIRNLRNKTVLLSAGDKNKHEFPACEVICIGLLDYLEKLQIASGILDFWVSVSDTSPADKEIVGKARGIAFVASILDKSKKKDPGLYNAMRRTANTRKFIIDFFSTPIYENYGFGELSFDSDINRIEEKLQSFTCDMVDPTPVVEDPFVSLTRTDLKNVFVEWEEKKTLVNIKENITIVVAASPVSCESTLKGINVKALIDGKDADVTINKKHKDTIGTQFVQNLAHYLGDIKGETSASIINIIAVEIKKDEKMVNIKDEVYSKTVKEILQKKPDIVYISASGNAPDRGHGIKGTLLKLCEDSIVITGARTFERRMAPPAFPGESVICAGREGGPHGSLLDFISNTTQKTSETSDESWAAAAETVCIAAAVLLKAQVLNLSSEKYTRLKNTAVMQNILARMCSHYPEHRCRDGYGTLMPTKLLTEGANDEFEKLINEVTDDEAPKTYWSGKTIT